MFNFIKQYKAVTAIICFDLIAIIIVIVAVLIQASKSVTIDIKVVPSQATIELNGHHYENFSTIKVTPGNYHAEISMSGLQTKELDLSAKSGDYVRLWTYLVNDKGEIEYNINDSDEVMTLSEISNDEKVQEFIANYQKQTSILDRLPIVYDQYSPDYTDYVWYEIDLDSRGDCPKVLCLKIIDHTGNNEQSAYAYLKELGYDPEDYSFSYEYQPLGSVKVGDE